jgi:3-phenylpropionate/trans-cinnamate dioxygenase ferredoxin subunit
VARHVVAAVGEIPPGGKRKVTVGDRDILVFNLGGEFFALADRCPHQGGSLCEGIISGRVRAPEPGVYVYEGRGEMVRCPWHAWAFDIRTGQSWFDPARVKVRSFATSVTPGAALVEGPYKAESIPVRVEDSYVVVEA